MLHFPLRERGKKAQDIQDFKPLPFFQSQSPLRALRPAPSALLRGAQSSGAPFHPLIRSLRARRPPPVNCDYYFYSCQSLRPFFSAPSPSAAPPAPLSSAPPASWRPPPPQIPSALRGGGAEREPFPAASPASGSWKEHNNPPSHPGARPPFLASCLQPSNATPAARREERASLPPPGERAEERRCRSLLSCQDLAGRGGARRAGGGEARWRRRWR